MPLVARQPSEVDTDILRVWNFLDFYLGSEAINRAARILLFFGLLLEHFENELTFGV